MILIGSKAIRFWFNDFPREPKDTDYVVDEIPLQKQPKVEYYKIPRLLSYDGGLPLGPNEMFTLKCSHIFWDIKWDKTFYDIIFLQSNKCKIQNDLFYDLYSFWETIHGKNKRPNFDVPNEIFFKDKVNRKFNHDNLHKIINPFPLFEKIKLDNNKAEIDEDSFYKNLSFEEQIQMIQEEAYVIALERFLIPKIIPNHVAAYNKALKALITRLSPIWLVIFILNNIEYFLKPKYNFYKIFTKCN